MSIRFLARILMTLHPMGLADSCRDAKKHAVESANDDGALVENVWA